ncbi:MAG: hypothetical protein V1733_09170 [bacterium]
MKKEKSKEVILVISMGFIFLYLVFSWEWAILVSFIIGMTGILSSWVSGKVTYVWNYLAKGVGFVVNTVLLTLTFFLLLMPLALIYKIGHKDPLLLSRKYPSYFIDRFVKFDKASFEKTW